MSIKRNIIDIEDIDIPIFRTYSIDRLINILTSNKDALVRPRKWDDPYENFFLRLNAVDSNGVLVSLEPVEHLWFGQCWTTNDDSDALWRIYSPSKNGVKVKTTAKKLFSNFKSPSSIHGNLKYFIGRVSYKSIDDISNILTSTTFGDVALGGQNDGFARLLCIKREAFAHESEIRLLFADVHNAAGGSDFFEYDLIANEIFEEIVIDPRLDTKDVQHFESKLRASGAKIPIRQSDLYRPPSVNIRI